MFALEVLYRNIVCTPVTIVFEGTVTGSCKFTPTQLLVAALQSPGYWVVAVTSEALVERTQLDAADVVSMVCMFVSLPLETDPLLISSI